MAEEEVLVVKREVLEANGPLFHGLCFDIEDYVSRIFAPGNLSFMPRSEAENDPSYKQLIPYVLMTCNGKFLSYVRGKRGGEKRLVGNRSMGIGGHINPIDNVNSGSEMDYKDVYRRAVEREVEEEVIVDTTHTDRIVALLNDDTNEVGKVHIGVVHLWSLDAEAVDKREQMITQIGFSSPQELDAIKDTMETWSSLCLDGVDHMLDHKGHDIL